MSYTHLLSICRAVKKKYYIQFQNYLYMGTSTHPPASPHLLTIRLAPLIFSTLLSEWQIQLPIVALTVFDGVL